MKISGKISVVGFDPILRTVIFILSEKIVECPSKKNDNIYAIVWDKRSISSLNIPDNWIKTQFTSSKAVKAKLRHFVEVYNPANLPFQPSQSTQPSQSQQLQATGQSASQQTNNTSTTASQQNNQTQDDNNPTNNSTVDDNNPTNNRNAQEPPQPPSTAERARRRAAIRNVPDASLRRSPCRHSTSTSNMPSTQERAQGRAALMTAPEGVLSPSTQGGTPTNEVATRLFGSASTGGSSRTTRQQRVNNNNNSTEASDDETNNDNSSSDEDESGGYDLDVNETVHRDSDPLLEYNDSDDEDNPDEENASSGSDDEDPNNSTNLKVLIDNLHFHFKEVDSSDNAFSWVGQERNNRSMFRGGDGLKVGIADIFHTPFDCLRVVGGLSKSIISDMAAATNQYFRNKIRPNLMGRRGYFHSQKWRDVTMQEMTRFLGIILMMSLRPVDGGGYAAYFTNSNMMYSLGTAIPAMEIADSAGWASKYMRLARFRQIRGAFHPESKEAGRGGDKCYQLRRLIQAVNSASRRSFKIPQDLAFDEGGIGCRSRYCPVRQYNKDKPAKFRVDFFILASSTSYAILHLDVYQGKNATNSYIRHEAQRLPTTMKAVVNACYALELNKETRGFRHLSMDNRYAAPQLLVILRDRLKVLATGTVRVNRVGWNKVLMDLKKTKTNRGTMKLGHDEVNGILIGQWVDSKVVNFVSSYENVGTGQLQRQVGQTKKDFRCPQALIRYQDNMGGIDRGDQMRSQMGGFATHGHFKKWYKKTALGIMDIMLLNALIAWNMSAGDRIRSRRTKLSRHAFYTCVAQAMCSYEDTEEVDALARRTQQPSQPSCEDGHFPIPLEGNKRLACAVCLLEHRWKKKTLGMKGLYSNVGQCAKCGIVTHLVNSTDEREDGWKIHKLPQFAGKTCFEILHSIHGREIFMCRPADGGDSRYKYTTKKNHPLVLGLREKHGLPLEFSRKRRRIEASAPMEEDNESENESGEEIHEL